MVCIIPQHGHSVRLPRKAFREICGIPLVAWSVTQAKAAHRVDAVYVSTESEEIAEICQHYGAEIIWRPKWLQDKAFGAGVPIQHAMKELGIINDHVTVMHRLCTTPLLFPDDIDRMYKGFVESEDYPKNLNCAKETNFGAAVQEVVAYRRVRDPDSNMIVPHYIDKSHNMVIPMGGCKIAYADEYMDKEGLYEWYYQMGHLTDEVQNPEMVFSYLLLGNGISVNVPCRQWQTFEVDDEQGLEMCEVFMEKKILKGRGPEVYYEYARK